MQIQQNNSLNCLGTNKLKQLVMMMVSLIFIDLQSQNFDKRYADIFPTTPMSYDDPFNYHSAASCASVNENRYVTVVSQDGAPGTLICRFTEFDNNGANTITEQIKSINNAANIVPQDIIKASNSDYLVCGYLITSSNPADVHPWVAYLDASGNVISSRIFNDTGIFTRVEKLPNGNLVFVGFRGAGTFFNTGFRTPFVKVLNASLVPLSTYFVGNGTAGYSFDIMHDLEVVNDDSVILTGTVTTNCTVGIQPITMLLSIQPTTGVIHWQNNVSTANFLAPKILLMGDYIYQVQNASNPNQPRLLVFDKSNGNYIDGRDINISNFLDCENRNVNTDTCIVQSLLSLSNGNLVLTGTIISYLGDIPFDIEIDPSNFSINYSNAYVTAYKATNTDFMSYTTYSLTGCNPNAVYVPFGSTSFSTVFGDDIVSTTTYSTFIDSPQSSNPTIYTYFTWTFNNNYSTVVGKENLNVTLSTMTAPSHQSVIINNPANLNWVDFNLDNFTLNLSNLDCTNFYVYPCECN